MAVTIGVYTYVLWGQFFDFPFVEMIKSVDGLADEIVVVTDPRMADGTLETLKAMARENPKIRIFALHLDLNNPGLDGATKAMGRSYCDSDVLVQMDADEVMYSRNIPVLKRIANNWPRNVRMIGTGVINWFNGEHFKMSAAGWWKERMSLNVPEITHGIPAVYRVLRGQYIGATEESDGAGYIDLDGNSILADRWLCDRDNIPQDVLTEESVWIGHYSWYSLPTKWDRKHLWHWMWGNLQNQMGGITIDEYKINLDGEPVDFWNPTKKPPEEQIDAIITEMKEKSIISSKDIRHPLIMSNWIRRQPVYYPKKLWKKAVSRNM